MLFAILDIIYLLKIKKYDNKNWGNKMIDYYIIDAWETCLIVSKINGNNFICSKELLNHPSEMKDVITKARFFDRIGDLPKYLDKNLIDAVFISLHASNICNLNCKYCFRDKDSDKELTFEECKEFIDFVINEHPNANKFFVDPTGSGEPLMNIDLILQINEYSKRKSNEIFKEITVNIATNGTLLDQVKVDILQKSGIIFGVSIDGRKSDATNQRIDNHGKPIHKVVTRNVKKIKEKGFLGAAYTLTGFSENLVKDIKYLYKLFPTISMKPVRSESEEIGISKINIEHIKKIHVDLYNFLLKEATQGRTNYFLALLDGDDYFGKYMYRVIMNIRVNIRCDAGIGRFSLGTDKKIYACPAGITIPDLEIGSLEFGLDYSKVDKIWRVLNDRTHCTNCFAKYYCGGECLVNSAIHYNAIGKYDEFMCQYNRHLTKLAMLLINHIKLEIPNIYYSLFEFCHDKSSRITTNNEVASVSKYFKNTYTFTDIMKFQFENKKKYDYLVNSMKKNKS